MKYLLLALVPFLVNWAEKSNVQYPDTAYHVECKYDFVIETETSILFVSRDIVGTLQHSYMYKRWKHYTVDFKITLDKLVELDRTLNPDIKEIHDFYCKRVDNPFSK